MICIYSSTDHILYSNLSDAWNVCLNLSFFFKLIILLASIIEILMAVVLCFFFMDLSSFISNLLIVPYAYSHRFEYNSIVETTEQLTKQHIS